MTNILTQSNILDNILPKFIYFIIFIKIIFVVMAITNRYIKNHSKNEIYDDTTQYWKKRTEFIFIISMSILLIIMFNPWLNNERFLNSETKLLFYLFGWIMVLTADWEVFIQESHISRYIKQILK